MIARTLLPTDAPALVEFFRGMRGTIVVAFEEGTQAQWLHDLLLPVVSRVIVCDRRGEARHGNKSDHEDAEDLADQLRRGSLRPVYHGSRERARLKELARTYQNLIEDATRVMSRLKALFRARGIKTTGRTVYAPAQRAAWLAKLTEPGARFRAETLYAELEVLQTLHPTVKAAPGPFQDLYQQMLKRGMREELARVTLARKLAAITLRLWKTGAAYDPTHLTVPAR